MAQLLVNQRTGRVVTVQPDVHRWGRRESKQEWLKAGGLSDEWDEAFIVLRFRGRPANALLDLAGSAADLSALTPDQQQQLQADGELTLEPWQLEMIIR